MRSHRLIAWLRPAVLVVASVLVLGAAFVTADDAAHRVTEAAGIEAARSAETTVRASVDPLLAEATMGDPDGSSGRDIDALLERLVQPGGIARIKLWSPGGTILSPTCRTIRGRSFELDDDLKEALKGDTASQLHFGDSGAEESELDLGPPDDYLEVYRPVRVSNGTVIGAYEIYEDATSIVELIEATRRDVFIVAGLAATVLLLMLASVFNATSKTLASQNGRLVELAADLRGREARFRSLLQNSSDAQAILDADGRIRYESVAWNGSSAMPRPTGTAGLRLAGPRRRPRPRRAGDRRPRLGTGLERRFEARIKHADGTWRTIEAIGRNLLDDPDVDGIVITTATSPSARPSRISSRARPSTTRSPASPTARCSPTAWSHARSGRQAARRRRRLFIDLDDFKPSTTASAMAPATRSCRRSASGCAGGRPGDTSARLGGDEFAVLLEDVADPGDADEVAERVAAALATPLGSAASRWRSGPASASRWRRTATRPTTCCATPTSRCTRPRRAAGAHRDVRAVDAPRPRSPASSSGRTCGARRAPRVRRPLPADRRPRPRPDRRLRGARRAGSTRARAAVAGGVRADRPRRRA